MAELTCKVPLEDASTGLLADGEILALLRKGDLHIIPLVNIEVQLGSASLDIRLGTSFQIYLPASRRTPETGRDLPGLFDSRQIDLDFLEHIELMPGQFMLGHSFEYIKLPPCVVAQLDGRSSYARQGLEVHI